jgi:hypothetical protein
MQMLALSDLNKTTSFIPRISESLAKIIGGNIEFLFVKMQ